MNAIIIFVIILILGATITYFFVNALHEDSLKDKLIKEYKELYVSDLYEIPKLILNIENKLN